MWYYVRAYIICLVSFIMLKHVGKHVEYMRQKSKKKKNKEKAHCKTLSRLEVFTYLHPGINFYPCHFGRDEIESQRKLVNSKRSFTKDKNNFVPGWNFTYKHPLGVSSGTSLLLVNYLIGINLLVIIIVQTLSAFLVE